MAETPRGGRYSVRLDADLTTKLHTIMALGGLRTAQDVLTLCVEAFDLRTLVPVGTEERTVLLWQIHAATALIQANTTRLLSLDDPAPPGGTP